MRAYEAYYKRASQPLRLVVIGIEDTSFYKEMEPEAAAHVECHKFFQGFDEVCRVVAGVHDICILQPVKNSRVMLIIIKGNQVMNQNRVFYFSATLL